jgi:putative tricarboxylic transport membrane protein
MELILNTDFTFVLLGILGGTIAGLMPGVAMAVLMLLAYPLLLSFEVFEILQFYISAILISQFVGSIVATYFAIPGEISSIPAVQEGHKMALQGKASQAIFLSAVGSFIGGMVALIFLFFIWQYIGTIFKYFTSFTNANIITLVFLLMFISPCKNNFERFGFPAIGIVIGLVGHNPLDYQEEFFTFGIDMLLAGIPAMPVMMGLYTLPLLFKLHQDKEKIQFKDRIPTFNFKEVHFSVKHFFVSLGHAVVGFWYAIIPGIGLGLVSNTAYQLQLNLNKRWKVHSDTNSQYSLLAAETANNSGAFAVLLPLLIFGIPTNPSQAILFDMLIEKNFVFSPFQFNVEFVFALALLIVYTSVVGFILACPLARLLGMLYSQFEKHLYLVLSLVIISITLYLGYTTLDFTLTAIVISVGFIFGMFFRRYNTLRIIYFYLLIEFFVENWMRIGYHFGIQL